MKIEILIFVLLLGVAASVALMSCNRKSKTKSTELVENKVKEVETTPTQGRPAFVEARIKKTACYGECPTYEVTFLSSGKALYKGKKHVKMMGNWVGEVSQEQLSSIWLVAQKVDYFKFEKTYPIDQRFIADAPNTVTFLHFGQQKLEVLNNYDAPDGLTIFENHLLNLISDISWVEQKD